jgi:hypothetical protein
MGNQIQRDILVSSGNDYTVLVKEGNRCYVSRKRLVMKNKMLIEISTKTSEGVLCVNKVHFYTNKFTIPLVPSITIYTLEYPSANIHISYDERGKEFIFSSIVLNQD